MSKAHEEVKLNVDGEKVFSSKQASTSDVAIGATNTDAVITYTASANRAHVISGLAWSYAGETITGNLQIEDGSGNVVFSMDVTAAGAGFITFPEAKKGSTGRAMIITLAAGGSGVDGKLNVLNHWTE